MKIYVIRHGQTDWNVADRTQGKSDIELNSTGIEQAKEAKKIINGYDIDLIICSPLKRAMKTAQIVNEDKKCEIIYDKALEERGYGNLEGKTNNEIVEHLKNREDFNNYNLNLQRENIEPVRNVCDRVWNLLDKIKEKYSDKKILLVTHGGTCRAINAYFNGIDPSGDIVSPKLKNCEIREYEYKN